LLQGLEAAEMILGLAAGRTCTRVAGWAGQGQHPLPSLPFGSEIAGFVHATGQSLKEKPFYPEYSTVLI